MIAAALARRFAPQGAYAWVAIGVAFLLMLTTAGVRSAPSVLIIPLEQAFGWSRATISGAISVNIALYGLIGPFSAALMVSYGVRRTVVGALLILAAGTALAAAISAPWMLYLSWGVLVALGAGGAALALGATVANRWFVRHRGLAIGLLTASNASGQLLFLPVLARIAAAGQWRMVPLVITVVALALIPIVFMLLPERPEAIGQTALGADRHTPPPQKSGGTGGNPIRLAMAGLGQGARSADFWLLFASFAVCGFSTNGLIGTHLISVCADHGILAVAAANLLATIGVFDFIGTTISGWLTDRYNPRLLLFVYYALRGLSLLVLPFTDFGSLALWGFAIFYGLDWVATVPPTVTLTNSVFGRDQGPILFSWILAGHQLGAAAAALGAGVTRTETGSYLIAFVASGLACLIASALVLRIAPPSRPGRRGAKRLAPA